MATIPAQIWKSSAFTIDRSEGKKPGTVIFRLIGHFTARDMHGSLTPDALRNLFECPGEGQQILRIFDLSGVPYMDSAGLGMLVSQHVRCKSQGSRMVAAGATPHVQELFRLTKIDTLLPMAASVEEAEAH